MTEKTYGGRLENWFFLDVGYPASGNLYEDPNNRFGEGTKVYTSTVLEFDQDNMKIITRNSIYDLGQPMESVGD